MPLSTYTEAYWKIDLHNLFHFLFLRMDEHAQYEIRQYANIIGHEIAAKWCPIAWEAFLDYRVNALHYTRLEREILEKIFGGQDDEALQLAKNYGWVKENNELKTNREREEFETKAVRMGVKVPWGN